MTNFCEKFLTQGEQCLELLEVLDGLIEKVGKTPLTRKIVALCNVKLSDPLSLLDEAHREKLSLIHKIWMISLIWLLKFESKAFKEKDFPFSSPPFQFFEPLGRKKHADLLLWNDCLRLINNPGVPEVLDYSTAIDGWYATTKEYMSRSYEHISFKTTKRELIDYLKKEIAVLEKFENPINPETRPHHYNLIEVARTIGRYNSSDNNKLRKERRDFRDFSWKAYIAAHRNWCQRMSGINPVLVGNKKLNPMLTFVEDNKLKAIANGRQAQAIYPIPNFFYLL